MLQQENSDGETPESMKLTVQPSDDEKGFTGQMTALCFKRRGECVKPGQCYNIFSRPVFHCSQTFLCCPKPLNLRIEYNSHNTYNTKGTWNGDPVHQVIPAKTHQGDKGPSEVEPLGINHDDFIHAMDVTEDRHEVKQDAADSHWDPFSGMLQGVLGGSLDDPL